MKSLRHSRDEGLVVPVSGGEAATRFHIQRRLSQVQLKELQGGIGAEGGVELLG